jgi:septal ring factor EnvC (AmiA/AmiB activator)
MYDDTSGAVNDIQKDKLNIGQHDVRIQPGSTLPESKWAIYGVYLEAFQLGLVDRREVLKKNPEIFDKEGILQRMDEVAQLKKHIGQLDEKIKDLSGDLQTATREAVSSRKQTAVEKTKRNLAEVESMMQADRKVKAAKLDAAVKIGESELKSIISSEKGQA